MKAGTIAVAIVGAGGLARAMAKALSRSGGAVVTIASRRPAAAARLAHGLRKTTASRKIEDAIAGARVVLLAVSDRAIAPLAAELSPLRRSWRGVVVLHAAGAYGPALLAPLRARGAATGVLHPLAVLGSGRGVSTTGAYARIEGAPAALAAARRLCALAGLVPLRASGLSTPSGRASYHAAASLASNDVVALLAAAHDLLVRKGVKARDARNALAHLASGAIATVRVAGLGGALTGPVARNDVGTLSAQLAVLSALDPAAAAAHRALSLRLIPWAEAAGRLDKPAARSLRRVLARGPGGSRTV